MIVHRLRGLTFADVEALAVQTGRAPATIRKHCTPSLIDLRTGIKLYDVDEAIKTLSTIQRRKPHTRTKRVACAGQPL